jgi:hypothetical protein
MALAYSENRTREEEEKQELEAVLQSGSLKKAPNLQHFLKFVAEMYFAGSAEEIKEYSIAVNALNRPENFDPQSDTIVRVTAHALRKKLEQYYASEGAEHTVHISIPTGKYVLQFDHKQLAPQPDLIQPEAAPPPQPPRSVWRGTRVWVLSTFAAVAILALTGGYLVLRNAKGTVGQLKYLTLGSSGTPGSAPVAAGGGPDQTVRIRFGSDAHPYTDVAGQLWATDQYCKGGSTFSHPGHLIQGSDDPQIFVEGREGQFQCKIPAAPGSYQMLLLFADTAGDKEAARQVDFSINNAVPVSLDVVDEAGGNDTVVGKITAGIHPMSDGAIHLDFTSDGSFVNAVELTAATSDAGNALRMVAGQSVVHDSQGKTWAPDRFFLGGRRGFHPDNLPAGANARLFEWERYGHFRYLIPVVADKQYRISLYFSEGWFGKSNGGPGGIGSRVFDVYCNGTTLLKDFDILRAEKDGAAVITIDGVKPTAHGMLDLDFSPVKNYPLINAIEVEPEG